MDLRALSKITLVAILVVIVAVAGAASYLLLSGPSAPGSTPTPTGIFSKKDTVKVAIGIDLDTIDPHGQTTTVVQNVVRHVYETLLWYDSKGNLVPALAERWEVSSDGLVYTFYLRKEVKFHDGSKFNASVVKANVERWINPKVRVPFRAQLGPVIGAEVIDEYTVKIRLESPYAPFLRSLASYLFIASAETLKKFGNATITEAIGSGPYKFVSWEKGKKVVLERNDDYWGEKPYIKRIEWVIIPEVSTRVAALLAGDVDFAYNLSPADLERVKADNRFVVVTPVSNRVIFIAIIPKGPFADPKVRQALNYAVDKNAIINNVLYGLGIPADAPLPPHFFGHHSIKPYEYDPAKAKKLLEEAGFPFEKEFVFLHPTGRYLQDKQVAEAVQAYLAQVGVKVRLWTMDWPSFVAEVTKPLDQKTFDLLLVGWGPLVADAHFTLHAQFHSNQAPPKGLALAHYINPEVDKLLEQAMKELDESKRSELYKKAIEIIWQDSPWIFLYTQKWFYAGSKDLKDFFIFIDGEQIFFHRAYFG